MSKVWRYRALHSGRLEGVCMTHPSLDYAFEARLFEEGETPTEEWCDNPAKIQEHGKTAPGEGQGGNGGGQTPPPLPVRRVRRRAE